MGKLTVGELAVGEVVLGKLLLGKLRWGNYLTPFLASITKYTSFGGLIRIKSCNLSFSLKHLKTETEQIWRIHFLF